MAITDKQTIYNILANCLLENEEAPTKVKKKNDKVQVFNAILEPIDLKSYDGSKN
jgi:hypothetical protein